MLAGTGKGRKWAAVVLAGALTLGAANAALPPAWPPFLPDRAAFTDGIADAIERVWADSTFTRTVRGRPVRAPRGLYAALLDTPDLTAAAARARRLSHDEVRALGAEWYEAQDHNGAHGYYLVLERSDTRRVILSWGEHTGSLLGTIHGSALTVLSLNERDDAIVPSLTAHVRIDNSIAAALARIFLPIFGGLADRRLRETFEVAAAVSEWATAKPEDFCGWLLQAPAAPDRRERILRALPACEPQRVAQPAPPAG